MTDNQKYHLKSPNSDENEKIRLEFKNYSNN